VNVDRVWILSGISSGLGFLHSYFIVHRDIRPGSVFIRSSLSGDFYAIIGFLDSAVQLESGSAYRTDPCPCVWASPPEVIKPEIGYGLSLDGNDKNFTF
jgi:serine/threonine protein kinase